MSITITLGKSGRLVVPKTIRDCLGLREGTRLRLEVLGGKLEAVPEADDVRIEIEDGLPAIHGGPERKTIDAVSAIKADREARAEQVQSHRREK